MCEITIDNFNDNYSKIVDDLQSSSFVSIDCEFSGLVNEYQSLLDSPKQRYSKLWSGLQHYSIIQIGLSTFHYDKSARRFIANSYSFFLSPSLYFRFQSPMLFEMRSVRFLCDFEFDFNKLFYKGLNYLSEKDEAKVLKMIDEGTITLERNTLQYVHSVCVKVSDWRDEAQEGNVMELAIDEKLDDYIVLVIHYEIRKKFEDLWTIFDTSKIITIKKITLPEKIELLETKSEEVFLKTKMFDSLLGFSKIMKELRNLKKPIIGHNMLIDLMMIYKQFFDSLPKSYEQFKKKIVKIFPEVYDTKFISYELKKFIPRPNAWFSNSLSDLYIYFSQGKGTCLTLYMPIVVHKAQNYEGSKNFHEGGFDSFCTGFIFVKMAYLFLTLKINQSLFPPVAIPMTEACLLGSVKTMKNRVNIAMSTVKYLNLGGFDPKCRRPHRLHIESIKDQPLEITKINNELEEYAAVDIKKLSKCCGIITVQNHHQVENIIKHVSKSKEYRICKYNAFKHSNWAKNLKRGSLVASLILVLFCLSRSQILTKLLKKKSL